MDQKLAKTLLISLNEPKIIDAIIEYTDYRIQKLREQLETVKDDRRIHELQGCIEEVKRLYRLRDDFLAVYNQKEK